MGRGWRPTVERVDVQLTTGDIVTCDSNAEAKVLQSLDVEVVDYEFHPDPLLYTVEHKYTPDFYINPLDGSEGFWVEVKGYWHPTDRNAWYKMYQQHEDKDIRLAFTNPDTKIRKGSTTSYGDWAASKRIPWCDLRVYPTLPPKWTGVIE